MSSYTKYLYTKLDLEDLLYNFIDKPFIECNASMIKCKIEEKISKYEDSIGMSIENELYETIEYNYIYNVAK